MLSTHEPGGTMNAGGPDDPVRSEAMLLRAGFMYAYLGGMLAVLAVFVVGGVILRDQAVVFGSVAAGSLVNLTRWSGRTTVFLAVTRDQVIGYGIRLRPFAAARPGAVALQAPLPAVTATVGRGPLGRVLRISAPGQPPLSLILSMRDEDARDALVARLQGREPRARPAL
jgi:hypothetical protein